MTPLTFIAVQAITAAANFGISYLFPNEGPRLKDLTVSASTYGNAIPQIFGTARSGGNMIWADRIIEHKKKKQQGKGGGYYNNYTYTCNCAFAFARGPIQSIDRIWANGTLIYDATGTSQLVQNGKYTFTVYLGTEDQMPDPVMESIVGAGNTPAYRGLAYIMFENFPLSNFGNVIPQFAAQVTADADSTTPYNDLVPLTGASDVYNLCFGNQVGIDYSRGFIWMLAQDTTPGSAQAGQWGLRRFNSQGQELAQFPYGNTGSNLVAVSSTDGSLFVTTASPYANQVLLTKVDPITVTEVASAGKPVGTPTDFPDGVNTFYNNYMPGCVSQDGTLLLYFDLGVFGGKIAFHDTGSCHRVGAVPGLTSSTYGNTIVSGCPYLSSDFCILTKPDANHIALVQASTGQVLVSENHNVVTPYWAVYDSGNPGVVFAYSANVTVDAHGIEHAAGTPTYWIAKLGADTQTVVWRTQVAGLSYLSGQSTVSQSEIVFTNGATAYMLNTVDGSFVDRAADQYARQEAYEINTAAYQPNYDPNRGWPIPQDTPSGLQFYDSLRQSLLCLTGNSLFAPAAPCRLIYAGQASGAQTSLDLIVGDLLRQGGLTSTDFDLSAMTNTIVRGYGFANNSDIKGILAELRQVYLFDLVESDFMLRARMRGGATPDQNVNALCLGSTSPEARDEWKQTRIQEAELPARITMAYMNVNQDFEVSTASYKRPSDPIPTMFSQQQAVVQANIVMEATEAKNAVRTMMFAQWGERTMHTTRLPWAYLFLDPSDLIQVTFPDGRQYFERIEEMELGADLTSQTRTFGQNAGSYAVVPTLTGDGGGSSVPNVVNAPVQARSLVMNTPLLRDSDDLAGAASRYYVAAGNDGGPQATLSGASIYRSTNNSDYALLDTETSTVEWGVVRGTVPDAALGVGALDWKTQITIVPAVANFTLESITDDELWAGANPIVIGAEVIQFRDAVQNADGTWTISNLLRGQRGTGYACATHGVNEPVICLDPSTVSLENESLDAVGQNRWFKGVGDGLSINNTAPVEVSYYPRDVMPYAPAQIERTISTNGDIVLTWARRSRFAATLQDSTGDVPLGEASEAYEVYILSAPFAGDPSTNALPSPYVRMASVVPATPGAGLATWTYTAANQSTDGFVNNLDILNVVIYQISAAVGRGFPAARSIEPWRAT